MAKSFILPELPRAIDQRMMSLGQPKTNPNGEDIRCRLITLRQRKRWYQIQLRRAEKIMDEMELLVDRCEEDIYALTCDEEEEEVESFLK